jgi:ceramide glucosyltransferase
LTILKPLKGCNAETRRCLQSWFAQQYPGPLQILCGVASADDPVCAIVRQLLTEFPAADAQLVICGNDLGANGKVSTLRQLEPLIAHPLIMISDADAEVPGDFASNVAPLLTAPGVGLVNCFYRLANPANLAMRWEAVAINADFWSSVLQARSIQTVDFALGAVMSLPAEMLQKIGGFAMLSDYLADDFELGQLVHEAGGRIEFANAVVDCREAPVGWGETWRHQLRWARTIRFCQPAPYFLSILGNPILWPLLWVMSGSAAVAAPFFLLTLLVRIGTAAQQQKHLTDSDDHAAYWWLVPVKDLFDVVIWALAFVGSAVEWRGVRYQVQSGGKLIKLSKSAGLSPS